jgi:hypothetical protein
MGLEDEIYGSKHIRNYLKMFSEQHWGKVTKATLLVGICRLTELSMRGPDHGIKPLTQMSIEDLEELAVKMLVKTQKKQRHQDGYQPSDYKRYKRRDVGQDSHLHNVHSPSVQSPLKSSMKRSSHKGSQSPTKLSFVNTTLDVMSPIEKEKKRSTAKEQFETKPRKGR